MRGPSPPSNDPVARLVPHRGRPRKFAEPSRSVTLTLPEGVIAALGGIDRDLSRAVVRIAQPQLTKRPSAAAELAVFGGRAVIVVNPSRALEERTGIVLVPLSDGRALISFDESTSVESLELQLRDALEEDNLAKEDARIFKAVADLLKQARSSENVEASQRRIIVFESTKARRRRA
jgi:hypothetical protein